MGSRTSPYLQEKLILLGAHHVYKEVPKLVESLLGISVCESQVYRSVQRIQEHIEEAELPSPVLADILQEETEQVYGMVDGSFLFTDDGWKEVKVGRVFKAAPLGGTTPDWVMGQSEYVAQRGSYEPFTKLFETLLPPESRCKKVFVTDGATWITNWLTTAYPDSVQILDFFHVCEKLAAVPKQWACEEGWFEEQKALLLAGNVDEICASIQALGWFSGKYELVNYLEKNAFRMAYNTYRDANLMIGSGPIESSHRTLLQTRMKRSGQRWCDEGCDAMVKLRVVYRSGKESIIRKVLMKQAA